MKKSEQPQFGTKQSFWVAQIKNIFRTILFEMCSVLFYLFLRFLDMLFWKSQDVVETDLTSLNQKIQQLSAEVSLLKSQRNRGPAPVSLLNFSSDRSLRNQIKNG
jgi:hypothetical protein